MIPEPHPDALYLITGANGFVGSHLVDHLLAAGGRVRALVRRRSDLTWLDDRAERVVGDVTDPLSLGAAVTGVDTIVHCAAVVKSFRERTYFEVNEAGTRNLLRVCGKSAPDLRQFVLVSSLAAAGPCRDGRPVSEAMRPRPVSVYGRSKLAAERSAVEVADGIPLTIVRPPIVYGPRDDDLLTFFSIVSRGIAPEFPGGKIYSMIHARDLVRGIRLAADSEAAAGETYHLADSRAWMLPHLLGVIAAALDVAPRRLPVPQALLRLVGPAADAVLPALGVPARPLGDKVRELLPALWIADTGKAERDLGFRTEITLADGIRETAAFYRESGWIR